MIKPGNKASIDHIYDERRENINKDFLKIKIKRTDGGIILFLQSESFENFIRKNNPNPALNNIKSKVSGVITSDKDGWKGIYSYPRPSHSKFNTFAYWGGNLMLDNGKPNMSPLLAKGLAAGVQFEFTGLFSQSILDKYIIGVKKEILSLYREFLKPFGEELVITYRNID